MNGVGVMVAVSVVDGVLVMVGLRVMVGESVMVGLRVVDGVSVTCPHNGSAGNAFDYVPGRVPFDPKRVAPLYEQVATVTVKGGYSPAVVRASPQT